MAFKIDIDSELLRELSGKSHPKPFPEICDRMNLPTEKLVGIIRKHIQRLYDAAGMYAVTSFRDECEQDREQVERRLKRKVPYDDEFHLELCIGYFDICIDQVNHMKGELIRTAPKGIKEVSDNVSDTAIKIATTNRGPKAKEALRIYVEAKKINPGRTDNEIFKDEIELELEVSSSTFYDWVKAYNKTLKSLPYAQDS